MQVPHLLPETKRFAGRSVVQLEFGGQHALLLTVPKQAEQPAAAASSAPSLQQPSQDGAAAAPDPAAAGSELENGAQPEHASAAAGDREDARGEQQPMAEG